MQLFMLLKIIFYCGKNIRNYQDDSSLPGSCFPPSGNFFCFNFISELQSVPDHMHMTHMAVIVTSVVKLSLSLSLSLSHNQFPLNFFLPTFLFCSVVNKIFSFDIGTFSTRSSNSRHTILHNFLNHLCKVKKGKYDICLNEVDVTN